METVMGEEWRARDEDLDAIAAARNSDPFALLGPHQTASGWVIRVFAPEAISVRALTRDGKLIIELPRRKGDVFEALIPSAKERPTYRVEVTTAQGTYSYIDPYAFGPALGPLDDYLAREGTHRQLYRRLGAQLLHHEGVDGVLFAVWAPNATRVSVVGDFNQWDGRRSQMRRRFDSGLWEIFVPQLAIGAVYKFELLDPNGVLLPLKADPFGFEAELRPSTASVVADSADFSWTDAEYMAKRGDGEPRRKPMSIYEVHLGSWRRGESGRFLTYDELADQLIPYVAELGYTHLELLPISEHPLDESWGYQPIGLFAPTRRFGDPAAFARFVDRAHAAGLGVILDWVPAHFPTDQQGLARFDGTALYEHADPRKGFQPDWNTAIYNFGRVEVANFLYCNALYWVDRFHIDGLRVDAVASMLYLDYSRKAGRMAAERRRKQGKPRSDRLPAPRQRARLRRLSRDSHHRRGIDRLSRRFAADRPGRPWLRFQMEYGLDARHARLRVGRSDLSPLASQQNDLRPPLRFQRELRAADFARRSRARQSARSSARCQATNGSASPTRAPSMASCGGILARSSCSWARSSDKQMSGALPNPSPGGCSTIGPIRASRR